MWKKYHGTVRGVQVEGDKSVSPTKWWNHLHHVLCDWNTITVFEVSEEEAKRGYRIGYLPFVGSPMLQSRLCHHRRFRMKNGHEDCTFFAIRSDGAEIELTVVGRSMKDDSAYQNVPLY